MEETEFTNHNHICEIFVLFPKNKWARKYCPRGIKRDFGKEDICDYCKHLRIFDLTPDGLTITGIGEVANWILG